MHLRPRRCEPLAETLDAIAEADLITLGPGSLYTSVIPNLLAAGIADAVAASPARKVYVCNLMEEPGETDGFSASAHLRALYDHSREGLAEYVVVNEQPASQAALDRYAATEAGPVHVDREGLEAMGVKTLSVELMDDEDVIRHNASALARVLVNLALEANQQSHASES